MRLRELSADTTIEGRVERLSFFVERQGAALEGVQDVAQIDGSQPADGLIVRC